MKKIYFIKITKIKFVGETNISLIKYFLPWKWR